MRPIRQETPTYTSSLPDEVTEEIPVVSFPETPEQRATVWAGRITGIVGVICVLLALSVWATRHGHYRLVLAFLVVAMFCAILHSYTFENGQY